MTQTSTTWATPVARYLNKVAVVTGSSSGHGRAIALRLAGEGASIVCVDLRKNALPNGFEDDLDVDTDDLIEKNGARTLYVQADITDPNALDAVADQAVEAFGSIDVWVNNAGAFLGSASAVEESHEQFTRTVDINLTGTWNGCKSALRVMKGQASSGRARGRIVNIGSIAGDIGQADVASYSAAKGAVHNLTRALAIEAAPDLINVNAVAPGYFPTAINRALWDDPEVLKKLEDLHPLPIGVPADVAAAVAFLGSDDAAFVTGVILPVDGGDLAK